MSKVLCLFLKWNMFVYCSCCYIRGVMKLRLSLLLVIWVLIVMMIFCIFYWFLIGYEFFFFVLISWIWKCVFSFFCLFFFFGMCWLMVFCLKRKSKMLRSCFVLKKLFWLVFICLFLLLVIISGYLLCRMVEVWVCFIVKVICLK